MGGRPSLRPSRCGARKRRRGGGGGFEVVPAGGAAARAGQRPRVAPAGGSGASGVNTLRDAHRAAALGGGGRAAAASALWFRKAGFGLALFSAYYAAALRLGAADAEALREANSRPLPLTFRLAGGAAAERGAADALGASLAGRRLAAAARGVPRCLVAAANAAARGVRRAERSEEARALLEALEAGSAAALSCRQEAVSMLPVLALNPQPGDAVADLCAAPGSKTMMILEAVGPEGLVVANDADPKRVRALSDCLARHGRLDGAHPARCAALCVVNHGGERLPMPERPLHDEGEAEASSIGFDRVLCDVPCSGDGTVRKDSSVLPRWTPRLGTVLHPTQLAIALRGAELLRVGGTMVYSTCSLNPVEDEAVVAEVRRGVSISKIGVS